MSLLAMSSQSSPMPGLCRDQLSRLRGGVLNTVLAVPVILVMISAGAEAAAQDTNISGRDTSGTDTSGTDTSVSTFVMPVQTGTAMPANARISGNGWICFTGFVLKPGSAASQQATSQQAGGTSAASGQPECLAIRPPRNAIIVANSWQCVRCFTRDGDRCQRIKVPAYGYIYP